MLSFDSFIVAEAANQVTKATWGAALGKLAPTGRFLKNCRGAPFADMIIVPKGGAFVIFLQEKQGERAKDRSIAGRTVPTLKLETVQLEHDKWVIFP